MTLARGARVLVVGEIAVGANGRVTGARIVDGPAAFERGALESIRGWEFEPALDDFSQPVPATIRVTVEFSGD
jgi:TonB family protein